MSYFPYALYPYVIKPLLFSLDAEQAHDIILRMAAFSSNPLCLKIFSQETMPCPVKMMGLTFKNPLGLAAGLDKYAVAVDFFLGLGFSHVEVGTVTPRAQDGNPKPRLYRVRAAEGIINFMGFNNKGVDNLRENLKKRRSEGIVGVSIGKNENTPLEKALDDYLYCMDLIYELADYVAVNISCPNTPDLVKLQNKAHLSELVGSLKNKQKALCEKYHKYVPMVVKISPDLSDSMLDDLCFVCLNYEIDALTCTNTTVSRDSIYGMEFASMQGGLSGVPLRALSNQCLEKVKDRVGNKIPLIGVGGIDSPIAAKEKMEKGASLIQLYTSLIYKGPELVRNIVNSIGYIG